jgi:hypothetical protein
VTVADKWEESEYVVVVGCPFTVTTDEVENPLPTICIDVLSRWITVGVIEEMVGTAVDVFATIVTEASVI